MSMKGGSRHESTDANSVLHTDDYVPVGTPVRLYNLEKAKKYNGCRGVVLEEFDGESERVKVRVVLHGGGSRGKKEKTLSIKPENVSFVDTNEAPEDSKLLERIYEFVRSVDPREFPLDGVFKKILDPPAFRRSVFPFVGENSTGVPRSLIEILEDPKFRRLLIALMPSVRENSASILEGTRKRAIREGDKNPHMESAFAWPITMESFARKLIQGVEQASKDISRAHSILASPQQEYASCNQLRTDTIDRLRSDGVAVQDNFFGTKWSRLVAADVKRFCRRDNDGAFRDACTITGIMSTTSHRGAKERELLPRPRRAIVRSACAARYPALAEAADAFVALPFEINRKLHTRLAVPAEGDLVVSRFDGKQCRDPWYVGVRGEKRGASAATNDDDGWSVTCVYYPLDSGAAPAGADLKLRNAHPTDSSAVAVSSEGAVDAKISERSIAPRTDRLVLFRSDAFFRSIGPLSGDRSEALAVLEFSTRVVKRLHG